MVYARIAAAAASTCLLAASCAWFVDTQAFRYDEIERAPKPKDHPVPVVADTTRLTRPFLIIGMVQSESGSVEGIGDRELKEGLRREARKLGGDALINLERRPMGAPARHGVERGIYRDERPPKVEFRWVAEVITFDVPASTDPD